MTDVRVDTVLKRGPSPLPPLSRLRRGVQRTAGLAFHPASSEFPMFGEERLAELVDDLRANGQCEPIHLHGGRIVDGRNRYLACRKAGIEPWIESLPDDVNPFAFVWSLNGQRRDLTQDQRYLIWKSCAAKSGEWEAEQRRLREEADRARSKAASERPRAEAGQFRSEASPSADCGRTGSKPRGRGSTVRARISGTNRGAVERMDRLERERPDLAEQVKNGEITSAAAMRRIAKPHVSRNTGNSEWYTPPEYIEAARTVMGGIDTDPASCEKANRTVEATIFYTAEQDGLDRDWTGRVWLNPPYSQPLCSRFCEAVAERYDAGDIEQATVLVNNATDTAFFQRMLQSAAAVCFPKGRIRFLDPDGNPGAPLQGQAVLYFGPNVSAFTDRFHSFGGVCHVEK